MFACQEGCLSFVIAQMPPISQSGDAPAPQSSRQRIVATARDLFVDQGYLGVSMQQIADASGLRKASLYHHFKSKEDLFAAVMAMEMDRILREFAETDLQSGTIEERLLRIARINYRQFDQTEVHQLAMDFFKYVPESAHAEVHQRLREMESLFAGIFSRAVAAGELESVDPNYAATMFFHMMMALAHDPNDYRSVPPPPPDEAAALVTRVILHGLLPRDPGV